MNLSNEMNISTIDPLKISIAKFNLINNTFVMPTISAIGTFLNVVCFVVFMSPKFKQKIQFRYIIVNVFVEIIMCAGILAKALTSGINANSSVNKLLCIDDCQLYSSSYASLFIKVYGESFLGNSLYAFTGLIEICLTYDRYLMLKGKKNWFNKLSNFKYILIICFSISAVLFFPNLISNQIQRVQNSTNNFTINQTLFGDEDRYHMFVITSLNISNSFCVVVLAFTSALVYKEYRIYRKFKPTSECNEVNASNVAQTDNDYDIVIYRENLNAPIKRASELSKNPVDEVRQKMIQIDFLKTTLTLNAFYLTMRTFDMITTILYRTDQLNGVNYRPSTIVIRGLCFDLVSLVYSLNIVIFVSYNRMFKNSLINKSVRVLPIIAF